MPKGYSKQTTNVHVFKQLVYTNDGGLNSTGRQTKKNKGGNGNGNESGLKSDSTKDEDASFVNKILN